MKNIERIPTGVPGLDKMIGGGLPVPSITLVAGEAGTRKTTSAISSCLCEETIGGDAKDSRHTSYVRENMH